MPITAMRGIITYIYLLHLVHVSIMLTASTWSVKNQIRNSNLAPSTFCPATKVQGRAGGEVAIS